MIGLTSSLPSLKTHTSQPTPSGKKVDLIASQKQQKQSTPADMSFEYADTIQIIKTDGTVLCSYQTHQHIQQTKIKQIRRQVIECSRKLALQTYDNDLVELIIKGFYICFRARQSVIIYVVVCSTYSYSNAEQIINSIIPIYDDTLIQIFGSPKLPKNLSPIQLTKLSILNKKIKEELNKMNQIPKSSLISNRSQKMIPISENNLQMSLNAQKNVKKFSNSYKQLLRRSLTLKEQSRRLTTWIACKKYLTFIFFIACIMILCFMYTNFY